MVWNETEILAENSDRFQDVSGIFFAAADVTLHVMDFA